MCHINYFVHKDNRNDDATKKPANGVIVIIINYTTGSAARQMSPKLYIKDYFDIMHGW